MSNLATMGSLPNTGSISNLYAAGAAPSSRKTAKAKSHFFKNDDLSVVLDSASDSSNFTATKIMATMGPSIHNIDVLCELLQAGMVAGRVDLTWGPLEFHRNSFKYLKEAMKVSRRLAATVVDTMGRELMVKGQSQVNDQGYPWVLGNNKVEAGQELILSSRPDAEPSDTVMPLMYDKFHLMCQKGDQIQIARYLVSGAESSSLYLTVTEVNGTEVHGVAQNDAVLEGLLCVFHVERSGGLSVANVQNELPLLSEWDKECIAKLGSEFDIDFLNLSYCRSREDVLEARDFLDSLGMKNTKIMAKIESRFALLSFQGILSAADGIIISRGNLGLDCEPEKMALIQKTLIQACNLVGKPVIITRVVDTMVNTPRPTRAEATDVANAVLDGVDGIMLGAETLRGKYPLETVNTVTSICRAAEAVFDHSSHYEYLLEAAWEAVHLDHQKLGDSTLASQMVARGKIVDEAPRDGNMKSIGIMAKYSMVGSVPNLKGLRGMAHGMDSEASGMDEMDEDESMRSPYLSKLESIASSAVRAADKLRASLIIVYTHTGQTAELVAKYRPPVPILTLVVPHIVADSLKWKLEGSSYARHCLVTRGLMPVLATPSYEGEALLAHAISNAAAKGLVAAGDHVVVVQRLQQDFCLKVVTVDAAGTGILIPDF